MISDNVPIRIRLSYSSNRIELSTGIRIDRNKWDDSKKKLNNCTNKLKQSASDINAKLSEYELELQNILKRFEIEERIPNKEEIKYLFNLALENQGNSSKEKMFFDYFDEFVKKMVDWHLDYFYLQKIWNSKNHLWDFNPKLSFSYLNEKGLTNYVEFFKECTRNEK